MTVAFTFDASACGFCLKNVKKNDWIIFIYSVEAIDFWIFHHSRPSIPYSNFFPQTNTASILSC